MADTSFHTVKLLSLQERMRAGDPSAREELLRAAGGRLEALARKMLRRFPSVARWAEAEDVLQNALLRLLRALEEVRARSVRQFFGLAAEQMRRELLDLARHFYGSHGIGANHDSVALREDERPSPIEPADQREADELEEWCAFHREVARLPAREREVVGLVYYHGWTQDQVAELFQVSDRTVRRWLESALAALQRAVRGDAGRPPGPGEPTP